MPSKADKKELISKSCPDCSGQKGLRPIVYGLPDGPPDPALYLLGGCCVTDDDPDFMCVDCGWEGSFSGQEDDE